MSKDFREGFKQGLALGIKVGNDIGRQGCHTDIEDLCQNEVSPYVVPRMVAESDPQASALGYKADATKIDKKKSPKYVIGQNCASCALYQGKPNDDAGNCPLFSGKQVSKNGWCNAYAKKGY
jgi:hypothetical protein